MKTMPKLSTTWFKIWVWRDKKHNFFKKEAQKRQEFKKKAVRINDAHPFFVFCFAMMFKHGPGNMVPVPKLPTGMSFKIILGSFWDQFGIILGSFWDDFQMFLE